MKLSKKEFDAMQMGWRKWYIEKAELKTFKKFGLVLRDADILEVGCGNGYAASLITAEHPHSYTGLDVMPEQLEIARERGLQNAVFIEGSADDLSRSPTQSFDAILDFCILHHVEGWRTFFDESRRVLKDGTLRICQNAASTWWTPFCIGITPKKPCLRYRSLSRKPTGGDLPP